MTELKTETKAGENTNENVNTNTNANTRPASIVTLTSKELSPELINLEAKIHKAQKSFYITGEALNTLVNNKNLYTERHIGDGTFAEYVQEMFDMTRGYAYHMIDAFCVLRCLKDAGYTGQALPKTESQCRPMAKLVDKNVDKLITVWQAVISHGGKVTAKIVKEEVQKVLGITPPKDVTPKDVTPETPTVKPKDVNPLDILGANLGETGTVDQPAVKDDATIIASLESQIEVYKAQNIQLEQELLKARQIKSGAPKSKMALELYKAGFKALAASTTPEQMDELMALKTTLIGK